MRRGSTVIKMTDLSDLPARSASRRTYMTPSSEANLLVAARVSEQLANANTSHLMSGQTYASAAAAGRRGTTRGPPARGVSPQPPLIPLPWSGDGELNRIMFEQKTRDDRSGRMVL